MAINELLGVFNKDNKNAKSAITPTAEEERVASQAVTDPTKVMQAADVANIKPQSNQFVDPKTGQVKGSPVVTPSTVKQTETIGTPSQITASTYDATKAQGEIESALDQMTAATAEPTKRATVQGQLESLMADFDDGTPPWASGAMRQATAMMQARGLGASSMAGQAIVQAAMESATAIAAQDASTYAQFEMTNLNNQQQTMVFKTQGRLQGILSDQAAENASKQFNATSQNQVKQFMATIQEEAKKFNATQINTMRQFNAGIITDTRKFNAQLRDSREKFNAQNSMIIAQANAQWRQQITTANTAAKNASNMQAAKDANSLTAAALDNIWQNERDLYKYVWATSESKEDRAFNIALQKLKTEDAKDAASAERKAASKRGLGSFLGKVAGALIGI